MTDSRTMPSYGPKNKQALRTILATGLALRHQICPWPLTVKETDDLWFAPRIQLLFQQLEALGIGSNRGYDAIHVFDGPPEREVRIEIRPRGRPGLRLPPGRWGGRDTQVRLDCLPASLLRDRVETWLDDVVRMEEENHLVMGTMGAVFEDAATWAQVYKASPAMFETIVGLGRRWPQIRDSGFVHSWWAPCVVGPGEVVWSLLGHRAAHDVRARELPVATTDALSRHRPLLQMVAAEMLLLAGTVRAAETPDEELARAVRVNLTWR